MVIITLTHVSQTSLAFFRRPWRQVDHVGQQDPVNTLKHRRQLSYTNEHQARFGQPGYNPSAKTRVSQNAARVDDGVVNDANAKAEKEAKSKVEREAEQEANAKAKAKAEEEAKAKAKADEEKAAVKVAKGKAKRKVEGDPEDDFFSEDEVELEEEPEEPEEEPARQKRKYEKKGKKPRKKRPSPLAEMSNGLSPTSRDAAKKIKEQNRAAIAKYDFSWVTINDAYEILGLALTSDPSKALLFGEVFFDPQVFETPFVVDALYKLLPYDATEVGVEPGTKIYVENSEGIVQSVQHGDVVVQVGGKERRETVLFVVRHAKEGSGVASLEDVERKFLLNLQAIIVITHIQYPEHALVDLKKKNKRKNDLSTDFVEAIHEIEDLRQDDGELTGSRKRKL